MYDDARQEDDRLCARPHRAGFGPAADRRDDGRRRQRDVRGSRREDRHQPAVPLPCGRRDPAPAARRSPASPPRVANAPPTSFTQPRIPQPCTSVALPPSPGVISCAALGVALALPWLESLPVFAQAARGSRLSSPPTSRRCASASSISPTASSRRTGGPRAAAPRWSSGPAPQPMMPHREDIVFIDGLYNQQAALLDQPAPRPDERALGRAGQPRSRRRSASARRWTRCSPRKSATAPRSRASCSASSPTNSASKTACR